MSPDMMLTSSPVIPSDFEEYIDSVDWKNLEDGYGNSATIYKLSGHDSGIAALPVLLKALCSDNEDVRQDAVNDGIWGRAYHQGTLYSASPYAATALLILLNHPSITNLQSGNGDDSLAREILRFLAYFFNRVSDKRDSMHCYYSTAIESGRNHLNAIHTYLSDSDIKVRDEAESLIQKLS